MSFSNSLMKLRKCWKLRFSGRKARNNNKYLIFFFWEFLIEIIVPRNNCRLHLKWMLSCIKIIHFWLSSSSCLTETNQFWKIWMKAEAHTACFISSLWMDYVISFMNEYIVCNSISNKYFISVTSVLSQVPKI